MTSKSQQKRIDSMTSPVDISEGAVDNMLPAWSGDETYTTEMLRALRAALTASEGNYAALEAKYKRLADAVVQEQLYCSDNGGCCFDALVALIENNHAASKGEA
jgi:hypothetical protein